MGPRVARALLLLACISTALPARAEDKPPTATPASQPLTEAEAKRQAKEAFLRAETNYRLGRFAEALVDYEAALKLRHHPNIIFNIAQCHRQLKNTDRALFFYKLFLSDWERVYPGSKPPNEAEVNAHVATLEAEAKAAAAATKPPWEQTPSAGGELMLQGVPAGAHVFIDGALRAQGPILAPLALPAGPHLVRVERPGYEPWALTVTIAIAKRASAEVRLAKLVNVAIASRPTGAAVVVDGTERGWTPLRVTLQADRPHTVELRRPGYMPLTEKLTLGEVDTTQASYELEPTRDVFGARDEWFAFEGGLAFGMGGNEGFAAGEVAMNIVTLKWKHVSWTIFTLGGGGGPDRFFSHMETRLGYPFRFGRRGQHQVRLGLGFGLLVVSKDDTTRALAEEAWVRAKGTDNEPGSGPFLTLALSPSVEYLYQTRGRTLFGGGFRALVPITRNMAYDGEADLDGCPAVGMLFARVGWTSSL